MAKAKEVAYAIIERSGENDEDTKFVDLDENRFPVLHPNKKDAKFSVANDDQEVIAVMVVPVA